MTNEPQRPYYKPKDKPAVKRPIVTQQPSAVPSLFTALWDAVVKRPGKKQQGG